MFCFSSTKSYGFDVFFASIGPVGKIGIRSNGKSDVDAFTVFWWRAW